MVFPHLHLASFYTDSKGLPTVTKSNANSKFMELNFDIQQQLPSQQFLPLLKFSAFAKLEHHARAEEERQVQALRSALDVVVSSPMTANLIIVYHT